MEIHTGDLTRASARGSDLPWRGPNSPLARGSDARRASLNHLTTAGGLVDLYPARFVRIMHLAHLADSVKLPSYLHHLVYLAILVVLAPLLARLVSWLYRV